MGGGDVCTCPGGNSGGFDDMGCAGGGCVCTGCGGGGGDSLLALRKGQHDVMAGAIIRTAKPNLTLALFIGPRFAVPRARLRHPVHFSLHAEARSSLLRS